MVLAVADTGSVVRVIYRGHFITQCRGHHPAVSNLWIVREQLPQPLFRLFSPGCHFATIVI